MEDYLELYRKRYIKEGFWVTVKPLPMSLPESLRKFPFDLLGQQDKNDRSSKKILFIYCSWESPSIENLETIATEIEKLENYSLDISGSIWKTFSEEREIYRSMQYIIEAEKKVFLAIQEMISSIKNFKYPSSNNNYYHINKEIFSYLEKNLNSLFDNFLYFYMLKFSVERPHPLRNELLRQLNSMNVITSEVLSELKNYYKNISPFMFYAKKLEKEEFASVVSEQKSSAKKVKPQEDFLIEILFPTVKLLHESI